MSRICVKNLPKHVSEDRLREVFSKKGEVTDAKLIRTEDRKSRQFAFVGFRTAQEAEGAINYFNNSYIDTRRIICEPAHKPGDPNMPRPWSRHTSKKEENFTDEGMKVSSGKSLSHASSKKKKRNHIKSNENEDPKLQEFLQLMQPRSKSKLWGNDTLGALTADGKQRQLMSDDSMKQPVPKADVNDIDDDNENKNQLKESIISDTDYFKSRVKKDWSDSESGDEDDNQADVDNSDAKVDDYSKRKFLRDSNNKKRDQNKNSNKEYIDEMVKEKRPLEGFNGEVIDTTTPSPIQKYKKDILETGRLFVRNLPFAATEDDLEELFSTYGNVSQVHIIVDKVTKMSKGYGYVHFALPEAAVRAFEELDNSSFQGRLLHIISAEKQTINEKQDNNLSVNQHSNNLKQRREEEKKASEASGNTKAWNSLFMRSDTVVENIARKHGISKSDLLDREADGLAAQIALGETQVIAETKKALVNAGVNVSSIEEFTSGKTDGIKRSSHVLLVKNLPYGSSEGELAKMFGKFGNLNKIILPPTKALALVVFVESAEARLAFKGLAYKRYKDAPLYLEWAPDNILTPTPTSESDPKKEGITGDHDSQRALLELSKEAIMDVDIDPDRVESRTLYIKNLNFKTSAESLKEHFNHHIKNGKILSLRIQMHSKNGVKVSKGFGFIELDSVDTATNVCRDLQGTVLDGHALILQFCHEKKDENVVKKVDRDRSSTKLIVRNVAFEATKKDLRQLFSPFGQIKRLRLPRRFGNHRGFAFVEYVTKQETKNALQALSNTHLYGRHLVLERAKEGESLEELRARTTAQFTAEQNGFQNLKKRKHTAILDEGSVKFERLAE